MLPEKIYIVGTMGSGKTYLAKKLSKELDISHYDLDDLYWKRKYDLKNSEPNKKSNLEKILKNKSWIIEGVYTDWVDQAVKETDMLIWLDTHKNISSWRIFKRYIKRNNSNESLKDVFNLIKIVRKYKEDNPNSGYYQHKQMIEKNDAYLVYLKNKKEVNKFLEDLF